MRSDTGNFILSKMFSNLKKKKKEEKGGGGEKERVFFFLLITCLEFLAGPLAWLPLLVPTLLFFVQWLL